MKYEIQFLASAAKEFNSLPKDVKTRVAKALDGLEVNPRPPGVRKLRGHKRLYRIRVGSYRVVYEIDDDAKVILVTRIRHRREVYR